MAAPCRPSSVTQLASARPHDQVPCDAAGVPLSTQPAFAGREHAYPKLWKHHGAAAQAAEITAKAAALEVPWLERYGGVVGLEWCFPKALEVFDSDKEVFDAMELWVEAGDWFVWQLTGGQLPARSTCQAGYKACWSAAAGFPSPGFFDAVRPGFGAVLPKMAGALLAPGQPGLALRPAAELHEAGLGPFADIAQGTAVSAASIDAHAGVPGVGVGGDSALVLVLGTSGVQLVNASAESPVPGIAGIVQDGILPGYVGYEGGQSGMGDLFGWLERFTGRSLPELQASATLGAYSPGDEPLIVVDHFNGCRTPLMDGSLRGSIHGLSLQTTPAELYRAVTEGTAFGCRRVVELLQRSGISIDRVVATGGLAQNPYYRQVLTNVLQLPLVAHPSTNGPAVGAAIYGASAAEAFDGGIAEAVATMAAKASAHDEVMPDRRLAAMYHELFERYMQLSRPTQHEQRLRPGAAAAAAPHTFGSGQARAYSTAAATRNPAAAAAKAVYIHGARDVRVGTLAAPCLPVPDGEAELEVKLVGICGSDLHYYKDGGIGSDLIKEPFVPGHEFAAVSTEAIPAIGAEAGEVVAVDPARPCYRCEWCIDGHRNLCPNMKFIGAPPNAGALTKHIRVPIKNIHRVPQHWSHRQVMMLEPAGIALHALDLAKPALTESVAVLGCGPIGLLTTRLLSAAGIKSIYAIDPLEYRARAALTSGASHVGTCHSTIAEWTNGRGCDLVIEATNSDDGIEHAARSSRIGGRVVLVGIPDGNTYAPLPADLLRRKALCMKTSRRMHVPIFHRVIDLIASGQLHVEDIVSHTFPLCDTAEAFRKQADYEDEVLKTEVVV